MNRHRWIQLLSALSLNVYLLSGFLVILMIQLYCHISQHVAEA